MSEAAVRLVRGCVDPKVKGGTRALFDAIAHLVPEGDTTTPLISMTDLAAAARLHRVTAVSRLKVLVELGEVRVLDGGQGKTGARYHIVRLAGTPPIVAAPLPLVGAAAPARPKRSRPEVAHTPDLFNLPAPAPPGDQRAINLLRSATSWVVYLLRSATSTVAYLLRSATSWRARRSDSDQLVADRYKLALPQEVPISVDVGASTKKNVQEHDPERTYKKVAEGARARDGDDAQTFLTWWMAMFPRFNGGAVYSLDRARDEPIVRALLDHGRPLDLLQAMAELLWTTTTDGVAGSNRWWIAERCPDRGLFALRHKANYLAREVAVRAQVAGAAADVWVQVRIRLEAMVNAHTFHTWFRDLALLDDRGAVILVTKFGDNSALFADWISKHYREELRAAVEHVRPGARVQVVDDNAQQRKSG